jgi:hypothetical protein
MKLGDVKVFAKYLNFNFCFVNSDGVFVLLNNCLFGSVVSDFLSVFRDFSIVDIVITEDEVKVSIDFTDVADLKLLSENILKFSGFEVLQ